MKETDHKEQRLAKMVSEEINHFQNWSNRPVSEDLENLYTDLPDFHLGLESFYSSADFLSNVTESLYAVSYSVVKNEDKSSGSALNPATIKVSKPSSDQYGRSKFLPSAPQPSHADPFDANAHLQLEINDTAHYIDFEETAGGQPPLEEADQSRKTNGYNSFESDDFKDTHEIEMIDESHVTESDDWTAFSPSKRSTLKGEGISSGETIIQRGQEGFDSYSNAIGGFGDFVNAISSEQESDGKREALANSSIPENWASRKEFEPAADHLQLSGHVSKKNKPFMPRERVDASTHLNVYQNSPDSHLKNEELFEEFSETIKQSYHKYYGKH